MIEPYQSVRELREDCEQLARSRLHVPVHVDVHLVPSLCCDFWSAELRLAGEPASAELLLPICSARGKSAALKALRQAILALPGQPGSSHGVPAWAEKPPRLTDSVGTPCQRPAKTVRMISV